MAPAFGNTKYSEFDGGDSIILAPNLLSAYNELSSRYSRAVAAYNSAQPAVAIALPDTNIDPETSARTSTFSLLATRSYNAVTNKFENVFANYIADYSGWTTPTTGNLADVASLPEALYLVMSAIKMSYDLITPNLLFTDPSELATIGDNADGAIECTCTIIVNESFDATTGNPTFTPWNFLVLLDEQQGV